MANINTDKSFKVYVCVYTHKWGTDVGVYRTNAEMEKAAVDLMHQSAVDHWDKTAIKALKRLRNIGKKIDFFNRKEEEGRRYPEVLDLLERTVY